ncbi:hypothetical protein RB195_000870 [Necator americanus]|uniref:ER membrane protein complex subunit 4 n=1 Tax=Necator americanus TaxID=51031 RepID=A0ABR1DBQ7_NECAM
MSPVVSGTGSPLLVGETRVDTTRSDDSATFAVRFSSYMEPEASFPDEVLSESVSMRRRSHSFSDDYSVQRTNDDATQCKFAAVQLGYWKDEFLPRFAYSSGADQNSRRDPEISIGYWARVSAVNLLVERFIEKTQGQCQIISIGCGFDTLFWRLKSCGKSVKKFIDVDFSSVTAKKIRQIRKPGTPDLVSLFSEAPKETQHTDLHCGDYNLVGADLRQWSEFKGKLESVGVDSTLPTLFLAECVLVYMAVDQSAELLKHIAEFFDTVVFVNYEQVRIKDAFGSVMEKNLEQRGIYLPGLSACSDIETQKQRFSDSGWGNVTVVDMNTVYKKLLPQHEVTRIEKIEHLDEMELLRQLLDHYCIGYALNDKTEKFTSRLVFPELTTDNAYNPPGFHPGATSAQHHANNEQASEQQEHLAKKRAWDVAMAPAKSLPMNMFMMYMAGRSVSIFPIMMVGMMLWRPAKALFAVNATFKPLEDQNTGSMIVHKIIFVLGNLGAIALAIYKVHTMGLLPNTPSDWLEFIPQPQRVQYSIMLHATGRAKCMHRMMASTSAPLIKKINRVLIANRGEIAIRVMNTARKMGIESVAVFSDADRNALFVKKADKAFHIGPAAAAQSYLNIDKIINTALTAGAEGIHPGYGFLSENAKFAERCAEAGIVFIGPPVQSIRDMGTKSLAKQIMQDAKVPVVEGFHGSDQSDDNLRVHAEKIGYPVMLKAVYGGGGKGMRIAWSPAEFDEKLSSARNEAMKSFGNDEMLVEKFVERPRHVEVQVFGDHHGNYVHLWERDCSVQRRHQKIIEEAPAPLVSHETRLRLGESAVRAAAAVGYVGAGTVEFIMDPNGQFYFMEMNTRLQVEHPVTEAITGTDLVEWQLKVAQGEKLPLRQDQIPLNGHSFECRVYAEDTKGGNFMPTAGRLEYVSFPSDARVDTGVVSGDEVSVHYDPMIAKVVVWAANRSAAAAKLDAALARTRISGLPTNIQFVRTVLNHPEFAKGNVYTDFIPDHQKDLFADNKQSEEELVEGAIGLALLSRPRHPSAPFEHISFYRLNHPMEQTYRLGDKDVVVSFLSDLQMEICFDGKRKTVNVSDINSDGGELRYTLEFDGRRWRAEAIRLQRSALIYGAGEAEYEIISSDSFEQEDGASGGGVAQSSHAPMPGIIEKVLVKPGDEVQPGQPLVVMTAMKMEYIIRAPAHCTVASVSCAPGKNVAKNVVLVKFSPIDVGGEQEKKTAAQQG